MGHGSHNNYRVTIPEFPTQARPSDHAPSRPPPTVSTVYILPDANRAVEGEYPYSVCGAGRPLYY
jgi:hypothetical protein